MVSSESCSSSLIVRKDISLFDAWGQMLISFEGGDRCGKTTQIELLKREIEKIKPVVALKHPNRSTATGKIIDKYLKRELELGNEAITLCLTSNLWETS